MARRIKITDTKTHPSKEIALAHFKSLKSMLRLVDCMKVFKIKYKTEIGIGYIFKIIIPIKKKQQPNIAPRLD
jgi:hypothetical protein